MKRINLIISILLTALLSTAMLSSCKQKVVPTSSEDSLIELVTDIQAELPIEIYASVKVNDVQYNKKEGFLELTYDFYEMSEEDSIFYSENLKNNSKLRNSINYSTFDFGYMLTYLTPDKLGVKFIYRYESTKEVFATAELSYEECASYAAFSQNIKSMDDFVKEVNENGCPVQLDSYTILNKLNYDFEANELQLYYQLTDLLMTELRDSDLLKKETLIEVASNIAYGNFIFYQDRFYDNSFIDMDSVTFVTVFMDPKGNELARGSSAE